MTSISDTIYRLDGTTWNGRITVSLVDHTHSASKTFAGFERVVEVVAGVITPSLSLEPNSLLNPANTLYKAIYQGVSGTWTEYWNVPDVASTTIRAIRVPFIPLSAGLVLPSFNFLTINYLDPIFIQAQMVVTKKLLTLPARSVVLGVHIKHSQAFVKPMLDSVSLTLVDQTGTYEYNPGGFAINGAPGPTAFEGISMFSAPTMLESEIWGVFSSPSNFGNGVTTLLQSGSVDVIVYAGVLPSN